MRPPIEEEIEAAEVEVADNHYAAMSLVTTRLAGNAVIRVVNRCNEAQESCNLDLSECQLMQIPDAIYLLMQNTNLTTCDLSNNVISKLPPKFPERFTAITELNLSHNQISKLPNQLSEMKSLQKLNISHNSFVELPESISELKELCTLIASHNFIIDVNFKSLESCLRQLKEADFSENPLNESTLDMLTQQLPFRVHFTAPNDEDWRDLDN
ncbi:malignant fibrous histiocytoma-amplified sequence 1-like [Adelges cooleyi]|uniref:malignant fibrous histiocytoma-amplified sequence 1-like n=1 Tax=Adelges cooleyi TaxID=133065 RepID=UPI0021803A63|nr:malignant fibrous histiocytoma-amplified sequence 1-like [Adelges cooleyi]